MMMKDLDYRSYIAGLLTGLLFLVITMGTMATFRRDLSGLRRGQSQNRLYERHVAIQGLQAVAQHLGMPLEDLLWELDTGKTIPEILAEKEMQQQEVLQQESAGEVGEGMAAETETEEGTGEATGMGEGETEVGGEEPGSAAAATGS